MRLLNRCGVVTMLCVALVAATGAAQSAQRPFVLLQWQIDEAPQGFFEKVQRHLQADLERSGADLRLSASTEPLAVLKLTSRGWGKVRVEVFIAGQAEPLASRDVTFEGVSEEGHALTLALATDELLRSRWSELVGQQPPPEAPPVQVEAPPPPPPPPPAPGAARVWVGIGFAAERYEAPPFQLGGDVRVLVALHRNWQVGVHAGVRTTEQIRAADGALQLFTVPLGAELRFAFEPVERWTVGALLGADAMLVNILANAKAGAFASPQSRWGGYARGGLMTGVRIGSVVLALEGGVGLPIAGVRATDGGQLAASVAGVAGWLELVLYAQIGKVE